MKTVAFLSAALLASKAYAQSDLGSAVVTNQCGYNVYLWAVPAQGGGYSETSGVLATGESYTQQWTQLTNNAGWSIKLSKSTSLSTILQYEYTYQNDGVIWYDLSAVDGNPWNDDWEITANGNCVPRQAAYRFPTDDAYGMQACNANSTITVTLCSGDDAAVTTSVPAASAEPTSTAAPPPSDASAQASSTTVTTTRAATLTADSTTMVTSVVITSVAPATTDAAAASSTTTRTERSRTRWWRNRPTQRAVRRHAHGHAHAHPN